MCLVERTAQQVEGVLLDNSGEMTLATSRTILRNLTFGGIALGLIGAVGVIAVSADSSSAMASSTSVGAGSDQTTEFAPVSADVLAQVFHDGSAGFVATEFSYALGPDAADSAACPRGLTGGIEALVRSYADSAAGARGADEADRDYLRRISRAVGSTSDGRNICMHPEAAGPDPTWQMVSNMVNVDGIDLDSSASGAPSSGKTCAQQDFNDSHGRGGIDNQFYRAIGCLSGFQSNAQGNEFQIEMLTGAWGILMTLEGVDSIYNDPEVEVGFYANADPIQLSASRKPLPFASYSMKQEPEFRAVTRGRIVDGVLTMDPVDVRFVYTVNSMIDDRVLRDAQIRMTFTPDGGLEGILGGYSPIEEMYDVQFGSRNGRAASGELASERLRIGTSEGRSRALGYSCQGAYHAMYQAADGHPDPETGRCTSISTQYRIRLAPAFVLDTETSSANASLTSR